MMASGKCADGSDYFLASGAWVARVSVLIGEKIMKLYRLSYFAAGFCAHTAFIEATQSDAWGSLLFAALTGLNLLIAFKNDPSA